MNRWITIAVGPLLLALAGACTDNATDAPAAASPSATDAAGSNGAGQAPFPLTVVDASDTDVLFEAAPRRIISYSPGHTEILYAIGAGDRVVATDRFSDFPPQNLSKATLEYSNPSPEAALAMEPDLVILSSQQAEQLAQYRDLGLTVYYVGLPDDLEGVLENIERFGRITGRAEQAAAVVAEMRATIDGVLSALVGVERGPRVFYEISDSLYTVAPQSFVGSLLTLLKAQNVAAGAATAFPQLTAEAVLEADPEVVILTDAEFGQSLETLAARPGWAELSAVASGRVYPLDADLLNRPGPRLAEGLRLLGAALYPELVTAP